MLSEKVSAVPREDHFLIHSYTKYQAASIIEIINALVKRLYSERDLFCSVMVKHCSFHSVLANCLNSDDSVAWLLIFK